MSEILKLIKVCIKEVLDEKEQTSRLQFLAKKFPKLDKTLIKIIGKNYTDILKDIKVVSYKPTTFQLVSKTGSTFKLENSEPSFICVIKGNRYDISDIREYHKAIKAINVVLNEKPFGQEEPKDGQAKPEEGGDLPKDLLDKAKKGSEPPPPKEEKPEEEI